MSRLTEANKFFFGIENPKDVQKLFESTETLSQIKENKDAFIKYLFGPPACEENLWMALRDFFHLKSSENLREFFSDEKNADWFYKNIIIPNKSRLLTPDLRPGEPGPANFSESLSYIYVKESYENKYNSLKSLENLIENCAKKFNKWLIDFGNDNKQSKKDFNKAVAEYAEKAKIKDIKNFVWEGLDMVLSLFESVTKWAKLFSESKPYPYGFYDSDGNYVREYEDIFPAALPFIDKYLSKYCEKGFTVLWDKIHPDDFRTKVTYGEFCSEDHEINLGLDYIIQKYNLKYNPKTDRYDCNSNVSVGQELVKDGKFVIKFGVIGGNFYCNGLGLKTLEGAPKKVAGTFECCNNEISSLEYGPTHVSESYDCSYNNLKNLVGAPKISKSFYCNNNELISLEGAPKTVINTFYCNGNNLTSLKGGPKKVARYYCGNNNLKNLKGSPKEVYYFACQGNALTTLEGAPEYVKEGFECGYNNFIFDVKHFYSHLPRMKKEYKPVFTVYHPYDKELAAKYIFRD